MKIPVYLYPNQYAVILDLDDNNRINRVMYQREIKLQKGLKNKIQFQFKNSDQKLLNISTSSFVFVLFDSTAQRNIVEKEITILDTGSTATTYASKGLGELVLTESELDNLESTNYKFLIKAVDTDGSYIPTYANTYYDVAGAIELKHDIYPVLIPSQEVTNFSMYYNADQDAQRYEYYTGNLNAHPEFNSNAALHTVAAYMTAYRGTVIVEGTLENSPMTFGHYATISTNTYNGFTGIDYYNFNGVFSKIRVRYIPSKNPANQLNGNSEIAYRGNVDKVLYRS